VTSNSLRIAFLDATQRAQQQLVQTQQQVSTGLKVSRPSDDPLASARIRELEAAISRLEQYETNSVIAQNRLGLEEEVLADVIETIQRVRELAVQGNNATQTPETRASIALELRGHLQSMIDLGNSVDANGKHLFAGFSEGAIPFVPTAAGIVYVGDQGQRMLQIGESRMVADSDPGSEVFMRIPAGNGTFVLAANPANSGTAVLGAGAVLDPAAWVPDTYTISFVTPSDYEIRDGTATVIGTGSFVQGQTITFGGVGIELLGNPALGDEFFITPSTNQDLFATVDNLATAFESGGATPAALAVMQSTVGQSLLDIDQAMTNLLGVRAEIGARLRAVDRERVVNDGFELQLTGTMSTLRDVDYAEAISLLNQQTIGLNAAQQSYARLQNLNLFRFL
jgi:flagellar hook-associated protein 3 FlgL